MTKDNPISLIRAKLARMAPPISGGCACGAFRYVCTVAPIFSCHCHCRACQRLSGAPFVAAYTVLTGAFEPNQAPVVTVERQSDRGHLVKTQSCGACASRLYAQSARNMAVVSLFASTLDDAASFAPVANVYASEAAPWITPDPSLFTFARMPPEA